MQRLTLRPGCRTIPLLTREKKLKLPVARLFISM
uniref:Hypotheticial protein n=1 Tax=Schistosoma japonicum TaxID=6182 RepID=C1LA14_SCHJA|nr:hypotheticial protein [Schistosoma japonicum]